MFKKGHRLLTKKTKNNSLGLKNIFNRKRRIKKKRREVRFNSPKSLCEIIEGSSKNHLGGTSNLPREPLIHTGQPLSRGKGSKKERGKESVTGRKHRTASTFQVTGREKSAKKLNGRKKKREGMQNGVHKGVSSTLKTNGKERDDQTWEKRFWSKQEMGGGGVM